MFKKLLVKIVVRLITKVFDGKLRTEIEPCIKQLYWRMVQDNVTPEKVEITEWYKKIARDEFILKHELVKVKKGNRRYDLLFLEDVHGKRKLKVTLHRHLDILHGGAMEVNL